MNLERAFESIKMTEAKQIPEVDLIKLIRKRLMQIHDMYLWNEKQLNQIYLETMPYFLLLGKKLKVHPKSIKVNLTPSLFDQDMSENLSQINRKCSTLYDEPNTQHKYENMMLRYLTFGLYLGLTPKRIEKELNKKNDLTHSLEFELHNHFIRNNYINESLQEKRG